MGTVMHCLTYKPQLRFPGVGITLRSSSSSEVRVSRQQALKQLDNELAKGDERAALSLVKDLQGKPGGLRCFGAARQVPQRLYTLDELKLNGIVTQSLLSPVDTTLGSIERNLQIAAVVGGVSAYNIFGFNPQQLFYVSLAALFLWTLDAISFNGGVSSLAIDTIGHTFSQKYHNRVIQHEAGHFLIAYLLGILPKGYTLTSLDAFKKEGSFNVQAGTAFVDVEFVEEVNAGKVSATTLNRFACIALAGVVAEYLLYGYAEGGLADINQVNAGKVSATTLNRFACIALAGVVAEYLLYGYAEGGLADINQLDSLLKSLGFTQKKTDSQVRWSVLNTVLIMRRHEAARAKLAEAMAEGNSVGSCINIIENTIGDADI